MNSRALEIQIYYEIAMAIGASIDLEKMLRTALSAYLRKLSCTTGMVLELQLKEGRFSYSPCFAIPRNALQNPVYTAILDQLPPTFDEHSLHHFQKSLPLSGSVNTTYHFHCCLLPDFGLLLLIRSGQPLAPRIVNSLRQLNSKLAASCLACLQNEKLGEINNQLSHEVAQRREAENTLKTLLNNLEQQVEERTRDLRESRKRYQAIFDNIQDIFFSLTTDGRILEISPSVRTALNYSRDWLKGRSLTSLGFTLEEVTRFVQTIIDQGSVKDHPVSLRARDRVLHYFSLNARTTEAGGESEQQIIGSLRDITRQHLMEESKKALEEQLQTVRKMEALGLLAGGVAHDLNNVLSGIVSFPDLLLTMVEDDSPLRAPLITVRDSGEKAAAIVQDLLHMARRSIALKELVNLNRLIGDYLQSPEHERLIGDRNITLTTRLQPDLFAMHGATGHLMSIIRNLIEHSLGSGADTITLATENSHVEQRHHADNSSRQEDYVTLTITDNGLGMTGEEQQRIFEPFYTKKVMGRGGTGLGMAVVWGTVQDHQGRITIDSHPGQETIFTLQFPACREDVDEVDRLEPAMDIAGQQETVLVVDDNEQQRHIAKSALESLNYLVHTAESGEEALLMLQHHALAPDIIILDMIMDPGLDGLDTYRLIRDRHPGQKVIIASGYSETVRVKEALRLGAMMYIRKPYLIRTIGTALRQCLTA